MSDIELVIKIDANIANGIIYGHGDEPRNIVRSFQATIADAIKNGTPLPKGHGKLIDADEYQEKINSVFPCKDKDDSNIRRATEMGLMSVLTIIEADKENEK